MTETTAARRAADLDALLAYARTLADRMGLPHMAFEVYGREPSGRDLSFYHTTGGGPPRHRVAARDSFFDLSPEARRDAVVRELVWLHLAPVAAALGHLPAPEYQRYVAAARPVVAAIAAAWAPCLPLPLVGLMRRAK